MRRANGLVPHNSERVVSLVIGEQKNDAWPGTGFRGHGKMVCEQASQTERPARERQPGGALALSRSSAGAPSSFFDSSGGEAADKLPGENEEEDSKWKNRQHIGRVKHSQVGGGIGIAEEI